MDEIRRESSGVGHALPVALEIRVASAL